MIQELFNLIHGKFKYAKLIKINTALVAILGKTNELFGSNLIFCFTYILGPI